MTVESCISFCTSKGFQYAGTEYSAECCELSPTRKTPVLEMLLCLLKRYIADCGNTLAAGAAAAAAADCSMACSGSATEGCGGPNRLSLYHTTDIVGPQVNPGVNGWASIGCYRCVLASKAPNGRMRTG